jgi:hypothetical protein
MVDEEKANKKAKAPLVYSVPEAGRLIGLSREGSYAAARRGEIPTMRIGRLLKVPVVRFNKMLEGE